jgi:hypothetical protein
MAAKRRKRFRLVAEVRSARPEATRPALEGALYGCSIEPTGEGFRIEGVVGGASAREANRELLSALRRIKRKTTLRSEWTSGEVVERFFDYTSRGTRSAGG